MDQSAFVWRFNHKQHYLLLSVDNCWHAHHTSMPFGMWFAIAYNCFITYNYLSVQNIRIQLWWIVVVWWWWWWCECVDNLFISIAYIKTISFTHMLNAIVFKSIKITTHRTHEFYTQFEMMSPQFIEFSVYHKFPLSLTLYAICSFVFVTLFASIGNM